MAHPFTETYNCPKCGREHHLLTAKLKCQCGVSLDWMFERADRLRIEQMRDELADCQKHGGFVVVTDRRTATRMRDAEDKFKSEHQ